MTISHSALVSAFLTDHQRFMRLLRDVSLALEAADLPRAQELAIELDAVAGPHIAFEEQVLYPNLRRFTHDRSFVQSLYDEHAAIVDALARLVDDRPLPVDALPALQTAFQAGLDHAEHCGTLISRLAAMSDEEQQAALDRLEQLRLSGIKWTEAKRSA